MPIQTGAVPTGAWETGNGSSTAVDISNLKNVVVMLGSTVALSGGTSLRMEITFDGTIWVPWDAAKTAIGAYVTLPGAKQFRLTTSSYSAGTAKAGYSGEVANA